MTRSDLPARERILAATLDLLHEGGVEAVSTRAITARADVQPPAIYRLFGDKDGLLEAAAERAHGDWVATKSTKTLPDDPVEALRTGWDDAVSFGLDQPDAYRISYARAEKGPSLALGYALLSQKIAHVARAGRLAVTAEQALALTQATARGVILTLIDTPPEMRDTHLSALARESTIAAITTDRPFSQDVTLKTTATALRALLPQTEQLQPAEKQLMDLWLERLGSISLQTSSSTQAVQNDGDQGVGSGVPLGRRDS